MRQCVRKTRQAFDGSGTNALFFSLSLFLYSTPNGSSIYGANASLSQQQQQGGAEFGDFCARCGKKVDQESHQGSLRTHTLRRRRETHYFLRIVFADEREREKMKGFAGEAEKRARKTRLLLHFHSQSAWR